MAKTREELVAGIERMKAIEATSARRAELQAGVDRLKGGEFDESTITNDPVSTGNERIDGKPSDVLFRLNPPQRSAHDRRAMDSPEARAAMEKAAKSRELGVVRSGEVGPDSDEALMYKGATEDGYDYRRGMPFQKAFNMVVNSPDEKTQQEVFDETMAALAAKLPNGSPMLEQDHLGNWMYLRPITDQEIAEGFEKPSMKGKNRWTSLESAGLSGDDLAKLFNASEVGSLVGGIYGNVKSGHLTFFKAPSQAGRAANPNGFWRGTGGIAKEGGFALAGREIGNLIRYTTSRIQGRHPDVGELLSNLKSEAGVELLTAMAGRGMIKGVELSKEGVVRVAATARGLRVVGGTTESVEARNAAARQTALDDDAFDAEMIRLGREERSTTSFAQSESQITKDKNLALEEPSGQSRRMNKEESLKLNAGEHGRDLQIARDSENMQVMRASARDANPAEGAAAFDREQANETVRKAGSIYVSPVKDAPHSGRVHPQNAETGGIEFDVTPDALVMTRNDLPLNLRGIGLEDDVHRDWLKFAAKEGKGANSRGAIGNEEERTWRKMRDEGFDVQRNPKAKIAKDPDGDAVGHFTEDGSPVWSLATPPAPGLSNIVSTGALAHGTAPKGGKAAQERAKQEFNRLIYHPTARQKAAIVKEASQNMPARVDMAEQLFKDYDEVVNAGGKYQGEAVRQQWFEDTKEVMQSILGVDEFSSLRAGTPGAFRKFMDGQIAGRNELLAGLGQMLSTGNKAAFKTNGKLMDALRSAKSGERQRSLRLIRNADPAMYESLQADVAAEVGRAMYRPVSGNSVTRAGQATFGEWLGKNTKLLNDMFPDGGFLKKGGNTEYVQNLQRFNRKLARMASSQGAKGVKMQQNPPLLQMTRTVMGVMNKYQRRLTAARKFQMYLWYGRTVKIVENPAKLKEMVALSDLQARLGSNSRIVVEGAIRLGLVDTPAEYEEMVKATQVWQEWQADDEEKGKE